MTTLVDLSLPVTSGMRAYPGHAHTVIYPTDTHEGMSSLGLPATFLVEAVHTSTHQGTHVDVPLHVRPGGAPLEAVPLTRFSGPGKCVDLSDVPADEPIGAAALQRAFAAAGLTMEAGDHILVRTGHIEAAHDARGWFRHTGLAEDAARWLAEAGAASVGIDAPSIDSSLQMRVREYPAHRVLLGEHDVLVVENLANLRAVVGRAFAYQFFPMPLVGVGGAPVRALARGSF